jgi:hypothetical protein
MDTTLHLKKDGPAVDKPLDDKPLADKSIEAKSDVKEEVKSEVKDEPMEILTLNLSPGSGGMLTVGGVQYLNGCRYKVTRDTAWTLLEIQNRGWAHESSLHASENKGRNMRKAFI